MHDISHLQEHLQEARADKDEYMRHPHSPLSEEQRETFAGLSYYPLNPDLILDLPLDRDVSTQPLVMETSTGDRREYARAGKVHFEVDGEGAEVTVYASEDGELFLPIRDATSGKETYGAGRYLEPVMLDDDHVLVDFNYLYNPYCAYNEMYSCPLPPRENWLKVPIRAGEKTFEE